MMKSIDKNTYLDRERERYKGGGREGGGQSQGGKLRRGRPKTKKIGLIF